MILCNRGIHKAIDEKRLIIDPEPWPRLPTMGQECPYNTHSVDLRLGSPLTIPSMAFMDGRRAASSCRWSARTRKEREAVAKLPTRLYFFRICLVRCRTRVNNCPEIDPSSPATAPG